MYIGKTNWILEGWQFTNKIEISTCSIKSCSILDNRITLDFEFDHNHYLVNIERNEDDNLSGHFERVDKRKISSDFDNENLVNLKLYFFKNGAFIKGKWIEEGFEYLWFVKLEEVKYFPGRKRNIVALSLNYINI